MDTAKLSQIIEAALMAAGRPLSTKDFVGLFGEAEQPQAQDLDDALKRLEERHGEDSPLELVKVSSGHRLQVRAEYSPWVSRLWEERTPRYSRAFMETLSIIAYRQPVTRGDIEDIRGVGVSSTIMRTLLDRRWVRAVGHRDVPGRPALYGTTREFLDYFGLSSLSELPELEELRDLDQINVELDFGDGAANAEPMAADGEAEAEATETAESGEASAEDAPALATVTPIRPGALHEAAELEGDEISDGQSDDPESDEDPTPEPAAERHADATDSAEGDDAPEADAPEADAYEAEPEAEVLAGGDDEPREELTEDQPSAAADDADDDDEERNSAQ
ncbi:MAG: SMC-Scp complex subunit ScpB [Pseudomonadota bacterium]